MARCADGKIKRKTNVQTNSQVRGRVRNKNERREERMRCAYKFHGGSGIAQGRQWQLESSHLREELGAADSDLFDRDK